MTLDRGQAISIDHVQNLAKMIFFLMEKLIWACTSLGSISRSVNKRKWQNSWDLVCIACSTIRDLPRAWPRGRRKVCFFKTEEKKKLGWVHTTPEEFETDFSLWKRIKCFPSTLRRRNLKNATITGQSEFEYKLGQENWSLPPHRFRKASFSKCFLSRLKRKVGVFKFLRFEESFRKAPFSWRISVDDRPNCRNKAMFSNSSGVMWTGL